MVVAVTSRTVPFLVVIVVHFCHSGLNLLTELGTASYSFGYLLNGAFVLDIHHYWTAVVAAAHHGGLLLLLPYVDSSGMLISVNASPRQRQRK